VYSVLKIARRAKITLRIIKFFQEHQLNSRRFSVFPGAISNSVPTPIQSPVDLSSVGLCFTVLAVNY